MKSKPCSDSQVLVLLSVYLGKDNELTVHEITPHILSPEWIPVKSRSDARLVHKGALEGLVMARSYTMDPEGGFIADLHVIFDGCDVRVEVWGMKGVIYRARMAFKRTDMESRNIPFIEWDAAFARVVPDLIPLLQEAVRHYRARCADVTAHVNPTEEIAD